MSMPTLAPQGPFELGQTLAPLRDRGTMIVDSGLTAHNLHWINPSGGPETAPHAASKAKMAFDGIRCGLSK